MPGFTRCPLETGHPVNHSARDVRPTHGCRDQRGPTFEIIANGAAHRWRVSEDESPRRSASYYRPRTIGRRRACGRTLLHSHQRVTYIRCDEMGQLISRVNKDISLKLGALLGVPGSCPGQYRYGGPPAQGKPSLARLILGTQGDGRRTVQRATGFLKYRPHRISRCPPSCSGDTFLIDRFRTVFVSVEQSLPGGLWVEGLIGCRPIGATFIGPHPRYPIEQEKCALTKT